MKSNENGEFSIKLQVKETSENEVIIKAQTLDKWIEKSDNEKIIKLDKEK